MTKRLYPQAIFGAGVACTALALATPSSAVPIFSASSGTNPNNDLAWQAAVGVFSEIDFDTLGQGESVSSFNVGGITVSPTLTSVGGPVSAFIGAYGGAAGGVYGTVFGSALLTCANLLCDPTDSAMTFTFSVPVLGFGAWVFDDDNFIPGSFAMSANGAISPPIDANPGMNQHTVEGFLGVWDPAGITSVTIFNNLNGAGFEIDHVQIAPFRSQSVPAPAATWLLALGLVALGRLRRNQG